MTRNNLLVILALMLLVPVGARSQHAETEGTGALADPVLPDATAIMELPLPVGFNTRVRTKLSSNLETQHQIGSRPELEATGAPYTLVGSLVLETNLLRAPAVGPRVEGAAFETAGNSGIGLLTVQGRTYELAFVSQVLDTKFVVRHVTARVLNAKNSYAHFSIGGNGKVVGTLNTPQATFRIVPNETGGQLVYQLKEPAKARRTELVSTESVARSLEQRHLQLAKIAEIRPELVLTSQQPGTLTIRGGQLGTFPAGKIDAPAVANVLQRFADLTLISPSVDLRIKDIRGGESNRRIEFEQAINGIAVWRRNVLILGPKRRIKEIRTRLVDPTRAQDLPMISEQQAFEYAERGIEQQLRRKLDELELINPPQIRYRVVPVQTNLVLQYWFDVRTTAEPGVWRVLVDAHTGAVEVTDPSRPADVFGYHICRDVSATLHPQRCNDPGAEVIWANPLGGAQFCAYHSPMGGGICVGGGDAAVSHTALLNANRALREIHLANPEYCCDLLGGPDRTVELVYQTSGATSPGAHYNEATESLMTPPGDTSFRSVEVVWHEFGHHVLHMYNPQFTALYGIPGEEFATVLSESFADLMTAGLTLLSPGGVGGDPWLMGTRNLADTTISFNLLVQGTVTVHERSRAISSFFYQVKVTSGISDRRFMELLLEFGDRLEDFNDDGFDLTDLENTLHTAVRPGEDALRSAINVKFEAMYAPLPPQMPAPIPPGQPPSAGAPLPPSPVSAQFLDCFVTQFGAPATRWVVQWTASTGATYYGAYLRAPYVPYTNDLHVGPELSRIAVIWGTDRFGLLARGYSYVSACNQSGCSSISNAVVIQMLPQCQ